MPEDAKIHMRLCEAFEPCDGDGYGIHVGGLFASNVEMAFCHEWLGVDGVPRRCDVLGFIWRTPRCAISGAEL